MINLNKNPFSDNNGNPLSGKEIDWLKWNSEKRRESNPFVDENGKIMRNKISEFSNYATNCQTEYQLDLLKLPESLRQELENNTRLLGERMQVEATGRR